MAKRRVGRDARAEQRGDPGQIGLVMAYLQHEIPVDDDVIGIAAEGVAAHRRVLPVIGADETRTGAILLLAVPAGRAGAAAVDHAADADRLADRKARHLAPDGRDAADDLVTGDARIDGSAPLGARGVQVRMADPAEQDVDRDVARTGVAAFEGEGGKRRFGGLRGIAVGGRGHGVGSFRRPGDDRCARRRFHRERFGVSTPPVPVGLRPTGRTDHIISGAA